MYFEHLLLQELRQIEVEKKAAHSWKWFQKKEDPFTVIRKTETNVSTRLSYPTIAKTEKKVSCGITQPALSTCGK